MDYCGRNRHSESHPLEEHVGEGAKVLEKYVKEVTFFADAGFRGCDWAQLCLKLGWNYGIRITYNTYLILADGNQTDWTTWSRALQPLFPKCAAHSGSQAANQCVCHLDDDEQGQPEMVAIITNQIACHARLRDIFTA